MVFVCVVCLLLYGLLWVYILVFADLFVLRVLGGVVALFALLLLCFGVR